MIGCKGHVEISANPSIPGEVVNAGVETEVMQCGSVLFLAARAGTGDALAQSLVMHSATPASMSATRQENRLFVSVICQSNSFVKVSRVGNASFCTCSFSET
jgi:hypothetical protein